MRTTVGLGVMALAISLAGCFLLTGGTSGYQLVDAGTCEGNSACPGIALGCLSERDCNDEGGTDVCCVTVSPPSSARSTCQKGPCETIQLCKKSTECEDTTTCMSQECVFAGAAITLRSCGGIPVVCSGD
jgi:hypothetical protein